MRIRSVFDRIVKRYARGKQAEQPSTRLFECEVDDPLEFSFTKGVLVQAASSPSKPKDKKKKKEED